MNWSKCQVNKNVVSWVSTNWFLPMLKVEDKIGNQSKYWDRKEQFDRNVEICEENVILMKILELRGKCEIDENVGNWEKKKSR